MRGFALGSGALFSFKLWNLFDILFCQGQEGSGGWGDWTGDGSLSWLNLLLCLVHTELGFTQLQKTEAGCSAHTKLKVTAFRRAWMLPGNRPVLLRLYAFPLSSLATLTFLSPQVSITSCPVVSPG